MGRAAADGIPLEAAGTTATGPSPDQHQSTDPSETEPRTVPPPPRPQARLAMPWSAISVAALGGAVLGAGLTYLIANWVALPMQAPPFDDPWPALESFADRADQLDARLADVEAAARKTQISLDATLVQLDTTAAGLRQSIAAIPAQQPVDLSAIEQELQTLESRVAAIAAGASSADASALADNLLRLEQSVTALSSKLAEIETAAGQSNNRIAGLKSEIDGVKAALAEQTRMIGGASIGPAVRLPLIVSGLESAFANGRPYQTELESLTALLPDLAVPEPVATAAATGLIRPAALAAQVDAAIPDILAGRTGESTGDWTKDAIEWAKALLALRPAAEIEGDTPEAIVSRLEGAVDRYDFIGAATLLAQLPEPMQQAAGELGTHIVSHAAAEQFVTGLRAQALTSGQEGAGN
jgi:hypothetical protein